MVRRSVEEYERLVSGVVRVSEILDHLDGDCYFSKREASKYAGLSIRSLDSAHDLPRYKPMGKKVLYRKSDIDAWMRHHLVEVNSDPLVRRVLKDLRR